MLLLTVVLFVLQKDLLVSSFQYVTIQIPYLFIPTLTFAETIVFLLLYPDSGISMDEEIVLGDMIWSYNKAELLREIISFCSFILTAHSTALSTALMIRTKIAP